MKRELDQKVRILERTTAREWERELKRNSPVVTGKLRDETTVTTRPGVIEAKADTDYAQLVRSGTRPHVIRARNRQALAFQWRGQTVIVKSVNHPGTRPNPWWDNAIRELPTTMQRIWAALR